MKSKPVSSDPGAAATRTVPDDGGPAFPTDAQSDLQHNHYEGMTLRDYFAAKVMQGLCANPGGPFQANGMSGWGIVNTTFDGVASDAYFMADAMLRARQDPITRRERQRS